METFPCDALVDAKCEAPAPSFQTRPCLSPLEHPNNPMQVYSSLVGNRECPLPAPPLPFPHRAGLLLPIDNPE